MEKRIQLTAEDRASFHNHADYCVGTGRLGLGLQAEYQEQLRLVQSKCHFKHIRGHGLFHEDLAIYQQAKLPDGTVREEYCFTYLDRLMDAYRACGLRPFLELGFMPWALASGENRIFWWKGNTTPPRDESAWTRLVKATLTHLKDRYGEEEVSQWPCEIWNEPNLPGFWENADLEKYLRLYQITALAVKEALPNMRVGGPAVCGGNTIEDWMERFLCFCRDEKLPLDFVSRHAYMGAAPERKGRYLYHTMCDTDFTIEEVRRTREHIDRFPMFRGLPLHITEFNTSYNPRCPIHDTAENAAHIAGLLAGLGDVADSYSYWTFGDVFEETGVPFTPFHGGFGMVADQCIPKPTLSAFEFFCNLSGECAWRDDSCVVMRHQDGSWEGVAWNIQRKGRESLTLRLSLPVSGRACLMTRWVDEERGNPLAAWHAMGEPASLTGEQLTFLREAAVPGTKAETLEGGQEAVLTLGPNAALHFALNPAPLSPDDGYDYSWYGSDPT
ncbi:MAG: xylan 1,4-beta-xylosidase [Clostridia bacterium]|nr:xylan 1,4-beta-xylosidase [Clostridia bacterium]